MTRAIVFVLCTTAVGQVVQRDPFDVAVQLCETAGLNRRFTEAAAQCDAARKLLAQTPVIAAVFHNRVRTVAELYERAGRMVEARAVVEAALARAEVLGESHPVRIDLLGRLAELWQQDGNLLRALSYREQAVAALETSAMRAVSELTQPRLNGASAVTAGESSRYIELADLYRLLGRPESATDVIRKLRNSMQYDPQALADFYERQGDLDAAIEIYKETIKHADANPRAPVLKVEFLQLLAGVYQRQQRWEEAVASLDQAAESLKLSGDPQAHRQAFLMRINVAGVLARAGQNRAAEQAYQTLLPETSNQHDNGAHFFVVQAYADYLASSKRMDEAEALLKEYLAEPADLQPSQQAVALFAIAQLDSASGRTAAAEQHQRAAIEKVVSAQSQNSLEGEFIIPDIEKAFVAAEQGNLDEAAALASRAIASAPQATDGDQAAGRVPYIANMVGRCQSEKGEQLYRQLLLMLEDRSVRRIGDLLQVMHNYASFLINHRNRWADVTAAIERYSDHVLATHGAESQEMEQVLDLRISFAQARGAQAEAEQIADELLAFEESLSGTTSEPYIGAAQTALNVYRSNSDPNRVLPLHRQVITIADLVLPAYDARRGYLRINAAMAFANARQFDQAERLANEAIEVGRGMSAVEANAFAAQAGLIRRVKAAAQSGAAPPVFARGVTRASRGRWFNVAYVPAGGGVAGSAPGDLLEEGFACDAVAPNATQPVKKNEK